ncbi:MAG: outer rane immunogenic protein [Verrucomicrobiota bacterium]|jgi:outer membrane immunogenic protein
MKSLTRFVVVFFATSALALTVLAGPESLPRESSSKDKEVMAAPAPSCPINWSGFYLGLNGGYSWGSADTNFDPLPDAASFFSIEPITLQPDPSGAIGGGQIGYNFQWNWLVLGVETDFQGSGLDGSDSRSPIIDITGAANSAGTFIESSQRTDWFGTARAKIGVTPFCRLLLYVTGGLAYGHVNYEANTDFTDQAGPFYLSSFETTKVGWTVGGGLEYALSNHWSLKAEYLYYDLGDESATAQASDGRPFAMHYNWETTANVVRGGLNFKF